MSIEQVVNTWDHEAIQVFVFTVCYAHVSSLDGAPPDTLEEDLDAYEVSAWTVCRIVANTLAGTVLCPDGIGYGDLYGQIHEDLRRALKAHALEDYDLASSICTNLAEGFVENWCEAA